MAYKHTAPKRKSRIVWWAIFFSLLIIAAYCIYEYTRPLPTLQAQTSISTPKTGESVVLPWPAYGQAAVGAVGYGVLEKHGEQKPVPIASVAKIMTALAVLQKKPLKPGEQGPLIKITQADIDIYNDYLAKDGSLAKVKLGEKISEYQALQALLLPSANNFAYTLAVWAFGSIDNYTLYAKNLSAQWNLDDTRIADASGFSPHTMSSAEDLVILGEKALSNPVIAEIVSQKTAKIPVAGTIHNVNGILGMDGVVGIKTGNTDEAGGCFLVAAERKVDGKKVTVIGAVMSAPNLDKSIIDSRPIVRAMDKGFKTITLVKQGQVVGSIDQPWGKSVAITAKNGLSVFTWNSYPAKLSVNINSLSAPARAGQKVGTVTATINGKSFTTDAVITSDIKEPSWKWRIFDR